MRILSWNVAGLRAMLKKKNLQELLTKYDYDIVCLQETKAEESQVELPPEIIEKYPFRFWNSTLGTTQRKGLSGTTIWSKTSPINRIKHPSIDEEGRITTVQFDDFIIVCVYTPNSQSLESPRYKFRTNEWDNIFRKYITTLKNIKPTIIAGDLNVAHQDIDIYNPKRCKNKVPGFFDNERTEFQKHIDAGFIDVFRHLYPTQKGAYTYWNQIRPANRQNNIGWRIDYFLIGGDPLTPPTTLNLTECNLLTDIHGSDHCPLSLDIDITPTNNNEL
jgi:exodeoxyribonuclease III